MMSLQKQIIWARRMQWTLAVSMVLAGGAFFAFAYRPQIARRVDLDQQVDSTRRELSDCVAQTRALGTVAADVERLEQRLKSFKQLPAELDWVQFYKDIANIQKSSSLKNDSNDVAGEVVRRDRLCQKPITFIFEGDFSNVYSFLRRAEEMPRLTRVPALSIERKDKDAAGQVKVKMTMNIYCLAD